MLGNVGALILAPHVNLKVNISGICIQKRKITARINDSKENTLGFTISAFFLTHKRGPRSEIWREREIS